MKEIDVAIEQLEDEQKGLTEEYDRRMTEIAGQIDLLLDISTCIRAREAKNEDTVTVDIEDLKGQITKDREKEIEGKNIKGAAMDYSIEWLGGQENAHKITLGPIWSAFEAGAKWSEAKK